MSIKDIVVNNADYDNKIIFIFKDKSFDKRLMHRNTL